MKTLFFLLTLLLTTSDSTAAIQLQDGSKNKNYLFENDPKALASVVQLVFRSGSLADPKGKEGLAQLAFRSLLRGTKNKSRQEFFAAVERLGANIDVDIGTDRTILSLNAVSENLQPALQLLAEAVLQPALKDEEIEAVRQEELASLHQELSNNRKLLKRVFRQAIFRGTALAFPPEGTLEGMAGIKKEEVRAFLASQVRAGSAIFAISSNRPEMEVRSWIESAFATLPEGKAAAFKTPISAPLDGRTLYLLDRKGSSTTDVAIGHFGITADRKDRDVLETGLYAFGEDMSSRLFKELREKKGWTYTATAGFQLFELPRYYGGGFLIYASPQGEHTEALVLRALDLYNDYVKSGLTPKELEFAKKSQANSYPFKFASSRSRLTARLYQLLEGAPLHSVGAYRSLIGRVTEKSLLTAIQKAHDPNNLAIVLVGDPERTEALQKSIPNVKRVVKVSDAMKAF